MRSYWCSNAKVKQTHQLCRTPASLLSVSVPAPYVSPMEWGGSGSNRRPPDYESPKTQDTGVLTLPKVDCSPRGIAHPQNRSGHARTVPNCLRTWSSLAKTLAKKPNRPSRLGVYDERRKFK